MWYLRMFRVASCSIFALASQANSSCAMRAEMVQKSVILYKPVHNQASGASSDTVVVRWIAGEQVERSIPARGA